MWDCLRNVKTYEIELDERHNAEETRSILRRLRSRRGVLDARFALREPHRIVVAYDADVVGPLSLLDFLGLRGVSARPASATPAEKSAHRAAASRARAA